MLASPIRKDPMAEAFYPPLDEQAEWALGIIAKMLSENSNYLKSSDCPYPEAVKNLLGGVEVVVPGGLETPNAVKTTWDKLQEEMASVFEELTDIGKELERDDDVEAKDKIAYIRAKTVLMEKLISMQERVHGIKQVSEFYRVVMDVMENVLSVDQRTQVMERLEAARG